jgi:Kef-type K+ transport system membrane component KefB
MKRVLIFSFLLILGLIASQYVAGVSLRTLLNVATLICLSFVMIHVGIEFEIDRTRLRSYAWDYFVAFTAATLPWIFCALYFVYSFEHQPTGLELWLEVLLLARFAAPTSAGVLFSMLAAAGLEETWLFRKARILAIFDDLDTILLLVPITMLIVGFQWELLIVLVIIGALLYCAWRWQHSIHMPIAWPWILLYGALIVGFCEGLHLMTAWLKGVEAIQIEVLLPAFVLGVIIAFEGSLKRTHHYLEAPREQRAKMLISALFLFLVGASMPRMPELAAIGTTPFWQLQIGSLSMSQVLIGVLVVTLLSNLGKMFPLFCYQKEATLKERFALSLGMCPRGEVGAGIIVIAMGLVPNLNRGLIAIAALSLALNLLLTGPFIMMIKGLLKRPARAA